MKPAPPDILVVDDDASDIDLMVLAHRRNGSAASMEFLRDGVEAVDYLLGGALDAPETPRALPCVVLLDLNISRMSGFDVLRRLRSEDRTRHLPVVIFSSSGQESDQREARRLGANDYIRKPAKFEDLCAVLAQLERQWLGDR